MSLELYEGIIRPTYRFEILIVCDAYSTSQ